MNTYRLLLLNVAIATVAAYDQTIWPDVGRAESKDDFDKNWGESQCICELADDKKNMCIEAFSDTEPRCKRYNNLVSGSCTEVPKSQVCGWKERCAKFADNPTLSSCIAHDHKFCALRRFLGGDVNVTVEGKENPVVWYQRCEAEQTCCDGQCCDAKEEVCVPMNSKDYSRRSPGAGGDYQKIMQAVGGGSGKAVFYYDFLLYDLEAVEVNGWKMPNDEEFKNRPMMCQKKHKPMDALQHARVWYRPMWIIQIVMMNLLWTLGALGVKTSLSRIDFLNPILLSVHCIFLAFSPWGNYAMLLSLVATATMSWPHDKWNQWLALGQFVALWHVLGGTNLLVDNDPVGFAAPNAYLLSSDHHLQYKEIQDNCQAYYVDYFRDAHDPWKKAYDDQTPYKDNDEPWGLCSHAWVTLTLFMAQNCMFYLALMFSTSLWKYAYPEPIEPGYVWCCFNKKGDAAVKPTDE